MSTFIANASPVGQASTRFYTLCSQILQPGRRHASSYRRSRSRLNIKPDASFLPSKTETHDHIIFNPPPSMPNVYHTPNIFLPQSDMRRQLHKQLSLEAAQTGTSAPFSKSVSGELPPPARPQYEKKYNITQGQVAEITALRKEDPVLWSVTELAKKFDCSRTFIRFVTRNLSPDKAAQQRLVTEVIKSRWGPRRRIAREDRAIRKEKYLRDA